MEAGAHRMAFAAELWGRRLWGPWAWLATIAGGSWQLYLDQWADTATQERWRAVSILPAPWWVVIAFAALAIWVFEAAYQRQRPLLSVFFGDPRWGVEWTPATHTDPIGPVIQLLIMTIENGQSAKLDECQAQIRVRNNQTPGLETVTHFISRPFPLRPDEHTQVRLLSYEFDVARADLSIRRFAKNDNDEWVGIPALTLSPITHHITVEVLCAQSKIARMHLTAKYSDRWHFFQGGTEILAYR